MSAALTWSTCTHAGRFRPNNEDAVLALALDGHEVRRLPAEGTAALAAADLVFAVSDGLGGAQAGELASRFAVERIAVLAKRAFRLSAEGLKAGFQDLLTELFGEIHQDLLRLGETRPECAGMGATLSVAWFTPEWLHFAHVGDSRVYYRPASGAAALRQLTHDHTHVGWLRRQGRISEHEARVHPGKNALQQALGAGHQFLEPQAGAIGCNPGDRFLLCSDGVTEALWDRRLADLLAEPATASRIVAEAVEASGRDNATAVVVELSA